MVKTFLLSSQPCPSSALLGQNEDCECAPGFVPTSIHLRNPVVLFVMVQVTGKAIPAPEVSAPPIPYLFLAIIYWICANNVKVLWVRYES